MLDFDKLKCFLLLQVAARVLDFDKLKCFLLLQVAARVLEIPIQRIHVAETSSDKVPNSSPTAASVGSDLYGEAVKVRMKNVEV